ncbi:MAG: hypothetical protein J1F22_00445 [Lachnospiraceae bacterium]|nr:hypothetical protein [Lachnospiraceae bacterium]
MIKRFFVLFLFLSLIVGALSPSATVYSTPTRNGIDVSEWQGKINWRRVSRTGIEYAYIRACVGSNYIDSQFRRNHRLAKRYGIKTGFYHYITARSVGQARRQARFFARLIRPYNYDLKPVMDFETFGGLSKRQINQVALAYLRELKKRTGKQVVIYSDSNNAVNTFTDSRLQKYPLWVAAYGVDRPATGQWKSYAGWQFEDNGRLSGINDDSVDFNRFRKRLLLKR